MTVKDPRIEIQCTPNDVLHLLLHQAAHLHKGDMMVIIFDNLFPQSLRNCSIKVKYGRSWNDIESIKNKLPNLLHQFALFQIQILPKMNLDLILNGSTNHFNFFRFCLVFVLSERHHLRILRKTYPRFRISVSSRMSRVTTYDQFIIAK